MTEFIFIYDCLTISSLKLTSKSNGLIGSNSTKWQAVKFYNPFGLLTTQPTKIIDLLVCFSPTHTLYIYGMYKRDERWLVK